MLTPDERKAIQAQLDELQPKIKELKQRLYELHDQKEKAFKHRTPAGKEISKTVGELKGLKKERNLLTDDVKKSKEKRRELNETIKNKIEEAKKLNSEKKKAAAKLGLKENPSHIKSMMDRLETTIETEAISFEKEKAIMKQIKELKKKYDATKKASDIWGEAHQMSKEIDSLRVQSDEIHRQIQQKAKQSQEKHELLIEDSKKIDTLRKSGKEFTQDMGAKKAEIAKLHSELDVLLKQEGELRSKIDAEVKEKEAKTQEQRVKKFSEKLAEVKAKMARGDKLTTEDIIVMQGEK